MRKTLVLSVFLHSVISVSSVVRNNLSQTPNAPGLPKLFAEVSALGLLLVMPIYDDHRGIETL